MALLINTGVRDWIDDDALAAQMRDMLPGADVRTCAAMGDPADIRMIAVAHLHRDMPGRLPNLELVQKLGAGVETIVSHPALPAHVRVARLRPEEPARQIAEWFLTYILQAQRHVPDYRAAQARAAWTPIEPRRPAETTIGVLGLGHIGGHAARLFRDLGFRVLGWSRGPKSLDGIDCRHGRDALAPMLGASDYLAAILPSTPDTRGLIGADMLAAMKPGSVLLNAGRGDLIDEAALIAALDHGPLAGAVLDVTAREPLPKDSPLWAHPRVTITPHVSGWHLGDALGDVAENYRRLTAGQPLLHEVDRGRGY